MILYILIDFTKLFFKNDNTNATAYNQDKQFPRAAHCGNVNKKTTFNFTKKKKKLVNEIMASSYCFISRISCMFFFLVVQIFFSFQVEVEYVVQINSVDGGGLYTI